MAAAADYVFGSKDVCVVEMMPGSPDAGDGCGVIDEADAAAGPSYVCQLADVSMNAFHSERFKYRRLPADQGADSLAASEKLLGDVLAEKASGAGDETDQLSLPG